MSANMESPAHKLAGLTLADGWRVVKKVDRSPAATGSYFSVGYEVESSSGMRAYLKALDFSEAAQSPDPARAFQALTEAFNFERDLCMRCSGKRLRNVVKIMGDGKVQLAPEQPMSVVQYLVFELADSDVRARLDAMETFDLAWTLRALHHIALGLEQLHRIAVAHQDLKPSNVLVFPEDISKLGDLGRGACRTLEGPSDAIPIAGDQTYAPPELLYGEIDPDWGKRRMGCDAYLFGSMIVFLFTRGSITPLILANMQPDHHPKSWKPSFREVLPYVRDAFGRAVERFSGDVPVKVKEELTVAVRELCEPDPKLRGHPRNRIGHQNQYSLERYVSQLDLLAKKAEYGLWGGSD